MNSVLCGTITVQAPLLKPIAAVSELIAKHRQHARIDEKSVFMLCRSMLQHEKQATENAKEATQSRLEANRCKRGLEGEESGRKKMKLENSAVMLCSCRAGDSRSRIGRRSMLRFPGYNDVGAM